MKEAEDSKCKANFTCIVSLTNGGKEKERILSNVRNAHNRSLRSIVNGNGIEEQSAGLWSTLSMRKWEKNGGENKQFSILENFRGSCTYESLHFVRVAKGCGRMQSTCSRDVAKRGNRTIYVPLQRFCYPFF